MRGRRLRVRPTPRTQHRGGDRTSSGALVLERREQHWLHRKETKPVSGPRTRPQPTTAPLGPREDGRGAECLGETLKMMLRPLV